MATTTIYTAAGMRERIARVPRVRFAQTGTPLQLCPRLSAHLRIDLLVKRDDLTGLAFGGNKTRNLEFRLAEARQLGADVVVAALEAQSNSARQTTAAANLLGMRTILLLHGPEPNGRPGNLLILAAATAHRVERGGSGPVTAADAPPDAPCRTDRRQG